MAKREEIYQFGVGLYLENHALQELAKVQAAATKALKPLLAIQRTFASLTASRKAVESLGAVERSVNRIASTRARASVTQDKADERELALRRQIQRLEEERLAWETKLGLKVNDIVEQRRLKIQQIGDIEERLRQVRAAFGGSGDSASAAERIVQLRRVELSLRESMLSVTTAEERSRIEGELKAAQIMREQLSIRRAELVMQERSSALFSRQRQVALENANLAAGMIAGSVGQSGLHAALAGVKGAADLQTSMIGIRNATNADSGQLKAIQDMAYRISAITQTSVAGSADMLKAMAQTGLNDPRQLLSLAPSIALFADEQYSNRGMSFDEGTKLGIQLAHQYAAYTSDRIAPILNTVTKLSQMMPDGINRYVAQSGYYAATYNALRVPQEQTLLLGAFIDRMGLGRGKGGTALQNFLQEQVLPLQMTKHMQQGKRDALIAMGLVDRNGNPTYYKNGQFDAFGALRAIETFRGKTSDPILFDRTIKSAFNTNAARLAVLFGNGESAKQLTLMLEQLHKLPGMQTMWARQYDTLNVQFRVFTTNFQSFLTDLMWPWLDTLKNTFKWLAGVTHDLQAFMHQHRAIAGASGLALAIGAIGAMGYGAWRTGSAVWQLSGAVIALGRAARIATGEVGVAEAAEAIAGGEGAAAVAGGAAAKAGLFTRLGGLLKGLMAPIGAVIGGLLTVIDWPVLLAAAIVVGVGALAFVIVRNWAKITATVKNVGQVIGHAFDVVKSWFVDIGKRIGDFFESIKGFALGLAMLLPPLQPLVAAIAAADLIRSHFPGAAPATVAPYSASRAQAPGGGWGPVAGGGKHVTVHGSLIGKIVLPEGTSQSHAVAMVDHFWHAINTAGDFATHPSLPLPVGLS